MTDETSRLKLPYILTNQAQKEVTHNEDMDKLDFFAVGIVNGFVESLPSDPVDGTAYILPSTDSVHPDYIADRVNGSWEYYAPIEGLILTNMTDRKKYQYVANEGWQLDIQETLAHVFLTATEYNSLSDSEKSDTSKIFFVEEEAVTATSETGEE